MMLVLFILAIALLLISVSFDKFQAKKIKYFTFKTYKIISDMII